MYRLDKRTKLPLRSVDEEVARQQVRRREPSVIRSIRGEPVVGAVDLVGGWWAWMNVLRENWREVIFMRFTSGPLRQQRCDLVLGEGRARLSNLGSRRRRRDDDLRFGYARRKAHNTDAAAPRTPEAINQETAPRRISGARQARDPRHSDSDEARQC